MDALLTAFVAAALAEWGDKTQLLVAAFAARFAKRGRVLAGVAVAALANASLAAAAGVVLHDLVTLRALGLLTAVALLYAGVSGLMRPKQPVMAKRWQAGAFLTTAVCFFLLEFGDKTQFVTVSLAAYYNSFALAAVGAAAGTLAASIPAAALGGRFAASVPLQPIRLAIAALFLLASFWIAINALRLI